MAPNYGIRYLVIGVGAPEVPAEDEDIEAVREIVSARVAPFEITALSERTSDALTDALLRERRRDANELGRN